MSSFASKKNKNNNSNSGSSLVNQTKMKVQVNIRNTNGKGWTKRNVKAAVVGDLKSLVMEMLQPSWKGFTLDVNNICVFRKEGNQLKPLPDNPETPLCADNVYFAVECFETVPTDVYRTVRIDQLQPSIYSHPDCLENESRWTCISPLYCAAIKDSEIEFPWHSVSQQENLAAHGVSLSCKDEATKSDIVLDPFRPVGEEEKVGDTSLTLEQYARLMKDKSAEPHPVFGILETLVSHQMIPAGTAVKGVPRKKRKKEKGETNCLASMRLPCFRYKLREGTNLAPFGMALIYDNSSEYHCTLVRKNETIPDKRIWVGKSYYPFLPKDAFLELGDNFSDDVRDTILREVAFRPFAEHEEPETIYEKIFGKPYIVFPKVAAMFVLHDFLMKASAEPMPLEKYDDPSQHSMYQAASVLYHIDTDNDVRMAIEELEGAAYQISDVDSPHVLTLRSAMQAAMAMDTEDLDEMGLDSEATVEALADGIEEVNGLFRATSPAKTPAPAARGASTNESPDSSAPTPR
jgi:hypothetical protein